MAAGSAPGERWSRAAILLALAFAGQAVILSVLRSGTSVDGAEQLVYTQVLDWGYGRSQPPLYTWLLIGVQQVLGVSQIAENALKFGLLLAGFLGIRALSMRLGHDGRVATATMMSLFAVVEIGLESQRNYAHSVLLFALMTWAAVLYLDILRHGGGRRFALLGIVSGLMLLSKYNSALFLGALVAADLSMPRARALLRPQAVLAVGIAAAIVTPHLVWALSNADAVFALTAGFVPAAPEGAAGALRGAGLYLGATASLYLLVSLIAAAAFFLSGGRVSDIQRPVEAAPALLSRWGLILWALGLVVAMATAATEVRMRWLVPVCVPLLPIVMGAALRGRPRATALVLAAGVLLGVLSTSAQWVESTRINPRTDYDYAALDAALRDAGLPEPVIAPSYWVLANLRLQAPRAFATPEFPQAQHVVAKAGAATLLWEDGGDGAATRDYARRLGFCPLPAARPRDFDLVRRHDGAPLRVSALAASRAACTD
ncbi:glycosyltransferase family 39 protein [Roseibacterium sp. SDUM158017]|uniref:glycosyltransferase family 39 protein n=1 Tax=Roseicyclus salinarum TaxID=3036773 RepID=UPI00241523FB|nr:glycosyltransferase family 39 protein [Roseibacterium sp. SDUM158017]MDG4647236.1 glycosyltransferase family 39 protein [Roseibacterium sp. SDUM158017]